MYRVFIRIRTLRETPASYEFDSEKKPGGKQKPNYLSAVPASGVIEPLWRQLNPFAALTRTPLQSLASRRRQRKMARRG
jgi:hypothetical protein